MGKQLEWMAAYLHALGREAKRCCSADHQKALPQDPFDAKPATMAQSPKSKTLHSTEHCWFEMLTEHLGMETTSSNEETEQTDAGGRACIPT